MFEYLRLITFKSVYCQRPVDVFKGTSGLKQMLCNVFVEIEGEYARRQGIVPRMHLGVSAEVVETLVPGLTFKTSAICMETAVVIHMHSMTDSIITKIS